jgi:hypothetical protein
MQSLPAATSAHCNVCVGQKNHAVLHSVRSTWNSEDGRYTGTDTYETLQCAGCDSIKLRHQATYPGEPYESETYFPAAVFRPQPRWFEDLIDELILDQPFVLGLFNEVYVALQHEQLRLATMGVRALLESIMISKVGDNNSFKGNVVAFANAGYLSDLQKERMTAILDAGHAAIHRSFTPNRDDVVTLIDIAEHIVESVYLHEAKVLRLRGRVPKKNKLSAVKTLVQPKAVGHADD